MTGKRAKRASRRTLVRWNDDMDVQILLALQKVCITKGMKLPFDEVGAALNECNPGNSITGNAIVQHLTKLRKKRLTLGLPVPEPLARGGSTHMTAKESGLSRKPGDGEANEEDDNSDISDISDASDPEASFAEGHRKRVKREDNNTGDDDAEAVQAHNTIKGRGKSVVTKKRTQKEPKIKVSENKGRNFRNTTPESPTVGAADRARRHSSINYAELNDVDGAEVLADVDEHHSRVATKSSLLGVSDASRDNHLASHESVSPEQHDGDKDSLVAVLKFGKTSQNSNIFSDVDRSSSHQLGLDPNSHVNTDSNALHFGINNVGTNLVPYPNDTNFGHGVHSPFFNQPTVGHYHGVPGPPFNAAMHNFMPPTPFTATGFGGFPRGHIGTYNPSAPGLTYESPYSLGLSQPVSATPLMSASAQTFHGYHNYPQRLNMDHTQLPHHSPSTNYAANMGSNTDSLGNDNNQRSPDNHTASTNPELASGMLSFGDVNDNLFLTETDLFKDLY